MIKTRIILFLATLMAVRLVPASDAPPTQELTARTTEQWNMVEFTRISAERYANPFAEVQVDVVFRNGDRKWIVPSFWAGGDKWTVRFAPPLQGDYTCEFKCSDAANKGLNGIEQPLRVTPYTGDNPLLKHGFLRVSVDQRHFEHADGTPFFWLGDTWWKCLCKRMTWEGFQELTADRKAKGFSVVQIVCGPYPDEAVFEARWENEGGKPYLNRQFTEVNPAYFEYADRRLKHLVEAGLVPAIVGGWGRGDCDGMKMAGVDGIKRHWRNLIARYGAYPTIWIIGGESGGLEWTEVARYVQQIDPYHRPSTVHPFDSGRSRVTDESVINFDMLQTGHGDWEAARGAIPKLKTAYGRKPPMPVMIGEYCYEGHMQTAFQDVQRYVFWGSMLSGSAGLTYGAAGVWHASVEGDPGTANVYDWTTWKEGMDYPGSMQLGLGKKLLEQYPWARFEPHPEWTEAGAFAAGIPGEVRFIYQPRRGIYDWNGIIVKGLERDVLYHGFYFNPVNAKRYDLGMFISAGPAPKPFEGHTQPVILVDKFDGADASDWKDYGTPTRRQGGRLVGGKGMVTIQEKISETNLMASVDARSDAEAGLILRFHDNDHYLVALYTPLLKAIYIHDRKNGEWGEPLGRVAVPEIGPKIHLTAAACGEYAAMVLTDGKKTYATPTVKVTNVTRGKTGLWLFQIGERQEYGNFELSQTPFAPTKLDTAGKVHRVASDEFRAPNVPSPQDWVLVMEKAEPQNTSRGNASAPQAGKKTAAEGLKAKAVEGDIAAHLSLAYRYRDGKGVKRDYAEAMRWAHLAADRGDAEAIDFVGWMFFEGLGVKRSPAIAAGYFKAAAGKSAAAAWNLGQCYFGAQGMEHDIPKALEVWKKAAAMGHGHAASTAAMVHLAGEGVAPDAAEARRLATRAAELNDPSGLVVLGEIQFQAGELEPARANWTKVSQMKPTGPTGHPEQPSDSVAAQQGADLLKLMDYRRRKPEPGKFAFVPMPHIQQGWNNCGATSCAMLARAQGRNLGGWDYKRLCPSPVGTGTDWGDLLKAAEKIGLRWRLVTFTADDAGFDKAAAFVRAELDAGRPVVIDFKFTGPDYPNGEAGHTLAIAGYIAEENLYILCNPAIATPGLQLMTAEDLKRYWRSDHYGELSNGVLSRPAIVIDTPQ